MRKMRTTLSKMCNLGMVPFLMRILSNWVPHGILAQAVVGERE
jgi:hypothetical protein